MHLIKSHHIALSPCNLTSLDLHFSSPAHTSCEERKFVQFQSFESPDDDCADDADDDDDDCCADAADDANSCCGWVSMELCLALLLAESC